MKHCVLIPVYNESRTIAEIVSALRRKNLDVVVVDDHSTDSSGDIARQQGAYVITRHEKNRGKGMSLQSGFKYILAEKYDGILLMDGDGQHSLEDVPAFLELAEKFPDTIIIGNRMNNTKQMPVVRYLTNRFMSFVISLACHQKVPDSQCGFRYLSCSVIRELGLSTGGYEIESEIIMKASKHKIKILSVPIQTIYGQEESKINPIRDTIRFVKYYFKETFSK